MDSKWLVTTTLFALMACGGGATPENDAATNDAATPGADAQDVATSNPDVNSPPRCSPANCGGCCAADGTCVAGTSPTACGMGGVACAACGAGQNCPAQQCVNPTCVASCPSGCCSGTTCLGGDSASACGSGGAECVDCGPAHLCTGNVCQLDPASTWDLVVVSGTVPMDDSSGSPWDSFGGLPDPYVAIDLDDGMGMTWSVQTMVQSDTLAPAWNETILHAVPASALTRGSFTMYVYDDDSPAGPDTIASQSGIYLVGLDQFDGATHDFFGGSSTTHVQFRVVRH